MNDVQTIPHDNGKFRQFLVSVVVNLLSISSGVTWGWPSPISPQLRSIHPPIGNSPLNEDQISWITSLLAIGGLLSVPFFGVISERYGRKKFALLTGLPAIVSWLLIIFGDSHIFLYAARLFGGMCCAMTLFIVPLYVSEIASEDIRGALGSLLLFGINTGELFAFVVGAYLPYRLFASISIIFALAFVATFAFMPETPIYLLRQNRPLDAHKSLMFLRGNNRALVEQELINLRSQTNSTSDNPSDQIKLKDFMSDRATRKGLIISFGLLASQQLSGIFAMISYAQTIFKLTGSTLSSEIASIIMAVVQIIGSYISTMLMERAGRRLLTLVSCSGMATSHLIIGIFFYFHDNNYDVQWISWLPLIAVSTFVVNYCLGIGPVPFVIISEVFRADVSSFACTLCLIFYWAICFASAKAFNVALQIIGNDGCFFMLAFFCTAGFVFSYCLLMETKGRDRQDIVDELAGIGWRRKRGGDGFGVRAKPI